MSDFDEWLQDLNKESEAEVQRKLDEEKSIEERLAETKRQAEEDK